MRYWVGVTDKSWFDQLRQLRPDEVNFWQPSSIPVAQFLNPGTPFLFKLHSPDNFVVGGGFFVRFSALPARVAWEAFGPNNGVMSYVELRRRIERYRGVARGDPEIGCNLLCEPFFWDRDSWIPIPKSWAPNTVRGRSFDTAEREGQDLWLQVHERLPGSAEAVMAEEDRYGKPFLARARLGQGVFRVLVTEAYERKCAVTGEKTLPVLEAAHIRPFAEEGPHRVSNGLLLRADLHKLFDDGYVTVTEDFRLLVSQRIREEFKNGREYYRYHGQPLFSLPPSEEDRPKVEFLRWHNEQRFIS